METVYKLTDKNSRTRPRKYNETRWGENVTHEASGAGDMCGSGWLYAYTSPLLAVLINPAHGAYEESTMQLWACKAKVGIRNIDKIGCTKITTLKQIKIPSISIIQKTAFAILIAKEFFKDSKFQKWADAWLIGKNRSAKAARAANVDWAAGTMVDAVKATVWAAARAAAVATDATWAAAFAAARAADAVEAAATWASEAVPQIDLIIIAKQAMKY